MVSRNGAVPAACEAELFDFFMQRHIPLKHEWIRSVVEFFRSEEIDISTSTGLFSLIYDQWLHAPLHLSTYPSLSVHSATMKYNLNAASVLQINWCLDIGQSFMSQFSTLVSGLEDHSMFEARTPQEVDEESNRNMGKTRRMFLMELSDGENTIKGIEYQPLTNFSVTPTPGAKVLVLPSVCCRRGFLLLSASNCQYLGGDDDKLAATNSIIRLLGRKLRKSIPKPRNLRNPLQILLPDRNSVTRTPITAAIPRTAPEPVVISIVDSPARPVPSARPITTIPDDRGRIKSRISIADQLRTLASTSVSRESAVANAKSAPTQLQDRRPVSDNLINPVKTAPLTPNKSFNPLAASTPCRRPDLKPMGNGGDYSIPRIKRPIVDDEPINRPAPTVRNEQGNCRHRDETNDEVTVLLPNLSKQPVIPMEVDRDEDDDDDVVPESPIADSKPSRSLLSSLCPSSASRRLQLSPIAVPGSARSNSRDSIASITASQSNLNGSAALTTKADNNGDNRGTEYFDMSSPSSTAAIDRYREDPIVLKYLDLNVEWLADIERTMRFTISAKKKLVSALVRKIVMPLRIQDDNQWTMRVAINDGTIKLDLECLVDNQCVVDLMGLTAEEAKVIRSSKSKERRDEGSARLKAFQDSLNRLDLLFHMEFFPAKNLMPPKIRHIETMADRLGLG